jgi:hypothetical protein
MAVRLAKPIASLPLINNALIRHKYIYGTEYKVMLSLYLAEEAHSVVRRLGCHIM